MSRGLFLPAYYVRAGAEVTFTATVDDNAESVRWRRDGRELPRAVGAVLTLSNVSTLATGTYSLVVRASGVEAATDVATLTVVTETHFSGFAAKACTGAEGDALQLGFVLDGAGGKSLLVRGTADAPSIDLAVELVGEKPIGRLPLPPGAAETSLITELETGRYSVIVADRGKSPGVAEAAVADVGQAGAMAHLVNASARGLAQNDRPLQIEFGLAGTTASTVLVRGVGPSLRAQFGLGHALSSAQIEVRDEAGELVGSNDGWEGNADLAEAFQRSGAFTLAGDSADAAVVLTLPPGLYRATLASCQLDERGLGLLEVYEVPSQ